MAPNALPVRQQTLVFLVPSSLCRPPPLLCCLHTGGALQASVRTVPLVRTTRPISDCALLTVLPSLFAPFQQLLLAVPQLFHHEDRRLPVPSPSCADNCGDVACISAQRMGPNGRVRQGMAPKIPTTRDRDPGLPALVLSDHLSKTHELHGIWGGAAMSAREATGTLRLWFPRSEVTRSQEKHEA